MKPLADYQYLWDDAPVGQGVCMTQRLSVHDMLIKMADSKTCVEHIADNELMIWSEEAIAEALRYAAECVAEIDKMGDSDE